jgi:hypothetical protein
MGLFLCRTRNNYETIEKKDRDFVWNGEIIPISIDTKNTV